MEKIEYNHCKKSSILAPGVSEKFFFILHKNNFTFFLDYSNFFLPHFTNIWILQNKTVNVIKTFWFCKNKGCYIKMYNQNIMM